MLRGLVQSKESMRRFSKRSSMHNAVCCFLKNVDLRLAQDDDRIMLNDHEVDDLLHEIRGILTSDDVMQAQGVAAIHAGRNLYPSKGNTNTPSHLHQRGGDTANLSHSIESSSDSYYEDTFTKSTGEMIRIEKQEEWRQAPRYNLREARTPTEQRRDRMKQSFVEDRRRNNHEHNLVRSKHAENTRKRLRERERLRVLQRFNPEAIRQIAAQTNDEIVRSRLLAIAGESMRLHGSGMSPQQLQQRQALEELKKVSQQGIGRRRIR